MSLRLMIVCVGVLVASVACVQGSSDHDHDHSGHDHEHGEHIAPETVSQLRDEVAASKSTIIEAKAALASGELTPENRAQLLEHLEKVAARVDAISARIAKLEGGHDHNDHDHDHEDH
ncbi:MAG: hypothetical protein AAF581_21040 [Planctomycetota bacterium]